MYCSVCFCAMIFNFKLKLYLLFVCFSLIRDIQLTPEQLQFFMVKIVRLLKNTDLQELPPVVYQLLSLSGKVGEGTFPHAM